MVTKEQAMTARHFVHVSVKNADGVTPLRIRASGKCITWKKQPERFKLPVKYGLYNSFYLTPENADMWNVA